MEEILASIKRVIAEETPPPPARGARSSSAPAQDEDVLELSDPVTAGEPLVSEGAAAASRSKLAALSAMREQGAIPVASGEGPLEAVVREMLKPILKEWLDQHLPGIVEELVTREIARIASGKDS